MHFKIDEYLMRIRNIVSEGRHTLKDEEYLLFEERFSLFDDICLLYDIEENKQLILLILNIYLVKINYRSNMIQSLTLNTDSFFYSIIRSVKYQHSMIYESIFIY